MSTTFKTAFAREMLSLAAFLALALWWSWPLAAHFNTHIGGGHGPQSIGDNLQFAWNFDHVGRAWARGESALESSGLFFPHRASLALHTMQWHHSTLAALARWVSPSTSLPLICNTLLVGTLLLNASATRLLCRHILHRAQSPNEWAAWLVGAGAAFGPIAQMRVEGHWNLFAWGYLPLWMLALLRLDQSIASESTSKWSRAKWMILAGVSLALAGWCDVQFVLMGTLWALALGVITWHAVLPAQRWSRVASWALAMSIGGVMLLPLVRVMLRASASAVEMPIAPEWALDVADLLSPSPRHPILGRWAFGDIRLDGIEWVASPGVALLVLGAWGWRKKPRVARPWAWSALVLWLLACGPHLQIAHRPVPAIAFSNASASVGAQSVGARSSTWASASSKQARREGWRSAVRLPFWWLRGAVGPLKSFRAPARLSIVALVCWSVCAAIGLASAGSWSRGSGARSEGQEPRVFVPTLLASTCTLLVLFECWRVPLPTFDARPPRWALAIRDTSPNTNQAPGVVPLPIAFNDWRLSWAMWAQTIHRRPLFNAYLSRAPLLPRDPVRATSLWRSLSTWARLGTPDERLELREPLPTPTQAALDLQIWRRNGAQFLVWQRDAAQRADEERVRRLFAQSRVTRVFMEDPEAVVWEIVAPPST